MTAVFLEARGRNTVALDGNDEIVAVLYNTTVCTARRLLRRRRDLIVL